MNFTCPKCQHETEIGLVATVPEEQTMTMVYELSHDYMGAKALGESIAAMRDLLVASAKQMGAKVEVMVNSLSMVDRKISVGYTILAVQKTRVGKSAPTAVSSAPGSTTEEASVLDMAIDVLRSAADPHGTSHAHLEKDEACALLEHVAGLQHNNAALLRGLVPRVLEPTQ